MSIKHSKRHVVPKIKKEMAVQKFSALWLYEYLSAFKYTRTGETTV